MNTFRLFRYSGTVAVSRLLLQPTLIDISRLSKIGAGRNILLQDLLTTLFPLEISRAPKIVYLTASTDIDRSYLVDYYLNA